MDAIPETSAFFAPKRKKHSRASLITEILQSVIIAVFVCTVIYIFIATPNQVSGDSMLPNFHDGELLFTNKIIEWLGNTQFGKSSGVDYQRGDVIVFQKPGEKDFIKRIIGLPGEKISIHGGSVYVNGQLLEEDYIPSEVRTSGGTFLQTGDELTVPDGCYFVLGDNRSDSEDSRYTEVGFISRQWMKGQVIFRYWPFSAAGIVGSGKYTLK